MNLNDNLENDFNTFGLSPESRDYLVTSAKWAKIISVTTLISMGVGFMAAVGFIFYGGLFFGSSGLGNSTIDFILVAYLVLILIMTLIGAIPFYFLYKFAAETQGNLVNFKGIPLHKGIGYLKSFFKTIVLFTVAVIVLYVILFALAMTFNM